jgi:integrase
MATYFKRKNRDRTTSILTLVRVKGFRPVSKSFKTKAEAEEWAERLEKELKGHAKRGGVRADIAKLTVGQLVREYLADPKIKALRSYEDYETRLDWWLAGYAGVKVVEFGVLMLREAREKLMSTGRKKKGRAPATVNRHLSVMRGVWNWGRSSGLIPLERSWPTKLLLTEPAGRARFLSDDELGALLKAAEADEVMRTAILVSVATGIRQGELLRLQWKDVNLDGGKLTLLKTKTATPRTVHVAPTAVEALQGLKKAKVVSTTTVFLAGKGQPLKKSALEVRWYNIRTAAKLVDFHWHDLRHSCASFLARRGATLLEIGSVLGHKSPSMTMRYSHLVQGAPVKGHAELDALLKGKP